MDFQTNIKETKGLTKPQEQKLYITNLPVELNEEGVREIFNYYGEIVSLFYRPNTTWAFVTYRTYKEAENAIRDLHDTPPLYLQVSLKKEKTNDRTVQEKSHHQIFTKVNDHPTQNSQCNDRVVTRTMGRGQHIDAFSKQEHQLPVQNYYENDDFLYPISNEPHPFDLSTISKNSLWTRGTVTVTSDGKRHISHGRGYTLYEIPDSHPKIEALIEGVHDKRKNDLYEHGQNSLQHMIGSCIYCTRPARMRCERCYNFYCNRECQEADWPRHKTECHKTPALIKDVTSTSILSSKENVTRSNLLPTQRILRRPKALATIHVDTINSKCSTEDELITSKNETTEEKESISSIDALEMKDDIPFKPTNMLSSSSFRKVEIVTILQNMQYWVHKLNQKDIIRHMKLYLDNIAKTTPKVKPVVGKIYVHKFAEENYRVKVISTNPTKVNFIDYCITKVIDNDNFYEIGLGNIEPFGTKIRLSKNSKKAFSNINLYDTISVKKVGKEGNNVTIVEVNHHEKSTRSVTEVSLDNISKITSNSDLNTSKLSTNDKTNKHNENEEHKIVCLPNVINFLSEEECGLLEVYTLLGNNSYGITLLPNKLLNEFQQIIYDLPKYCNSVKQDEYRAEMGDIVIGERADDAWLRGLVVSLQPLKLAMLDETTIESVQKVVPYPDFLRNTCKFGVICKVITNKYKLQVHVHYKFKILSCTNGIKIEIYADESKQLLETVEAVIKPWVPKIEQYDIKFTELKTESKVCIVSYQSHNQIYVCSLQPECVQKFHDLMQSIGILGQSAPYLKEPPVVGDILIAKYIDDNYYRAIVTKIQKEEVNIFYMDYGNSENIAWKKLQVLSDDLKQHPSCITKIILKDVPADVPINKDTSDYLCDLISREVRLYCHFEGVPSKDGVSLILENGESVNDKIKKLLTPSWEKDNEEDKTVYMLNDGNADNAWANGTTVQAIVVSILQPGINYVMCSQDEDHISIVYETLPPLMNVYCEKANYYIPRKDELCFGLYDNNWYRALCLNPSISNNECALFFLDYGNTENILHKNIRPMTKDFLTPGFLCNMCTVVNLVPKDKSGNIPSNVLERISELMSINGTVLIKIVEVIGPNEYCIELPQILTTLTEENLIS